MHYNHFFIFIKSNWLKLLQISYHLLFSKIYRPYLILKFYLSILYIVLYWLIIILVFECFSLSTVYINMLLLERRWIILNLIDKEYVGLTLTTTSLTPLILTFFSIFRPCGALTLRHFSDIVNSSVMSLLFREIKEEHYYWFNEL